MHELSIATEIYRACLSRLPGGVCARLERARVAIGELSAVEPDLLEFAWQAVTADGPSAGACLEIDWRAATLRCDGCGAAPARTGGAWLGRCPRCGGPLRIEGGRELDLIELSYGRAPGAENPA